MLKHMAVVQIPRVRRAWSNCRARIRARIMCFWPAVGHYLANSFPGTPDPRPLGISASPATASFILTRRTAAICSTPLNGNCTTGAKATPCGWKSPMIVPTGIRNALLKTLRLTEDDLYPIHGPLNSAQLMALYHRLHHSPELRDPPFVGAVARPLLVAGAAGHF